MKHKTDRQQHPLIVTDLNGATIEVTDLRAAKRQCKLYMGYRHEDKSYANFDARQAAYWGDLYEKLKAIEKDEIN